MPDSKLRLTPNSELNKRPVAFDSNDVEGCYNEDTAQNNIKMSYREPICVHDTENEMHEQHRSDGIQNARSNNCLGCTQFKHNADHTCRAASGRIERKEFECCARKTRIQEPRKKQNFLVPDNVQVLCDEDMNNEGTKVPPGRGRGYQMYQRKREDDERKLLRSLEKERETYYEHRPEHRRGSRERPIEYVNTNRNEQRRYETRSKERSQCDFENGRRDHRERLNTAMLESRSHSRSDQNTYDFHDPRNVRRSHSNVSEGLLEQQMQLMNEMFRMMSAQHEQLRSHSSNKKTLKVKPEKFSGSVGASFFSFIAQFENCSEINQWNEQEKILMLRSSLTGNALSILWDLGSDKDYSYEELVDMLKAR